MRTIGLAFVAALAAFSIAALLLFRLRSVLNPRRAKRQRQGRPHRRRESHLLIVLGSGGHTAEMMAMLERAVAETDREARLDWTRFARRTWVVSSGDAISAERARQFEERMSAGKACAQDDGTEKFGVGQYDVQTVPRAREIHQPLFTAPISSFQCLLACIHVLTGQRNTHRDEEKDFPDLILCNGPATATIMVFTSVLLRFIDYHGCNSKGKMRTVYVESWARVKKLSLSGTLLSRVVDRFLVQWPQLETVGGRAEFIGVLV